MILFLLGWGIHGWYGDGMSLRIATLSELPISVLFCVKLTGNSTTLRTSRLLFFQCLGMLFQPDCPTEVIERKHIVSINLTWMTRLCKLLVSNHPFHQFQALVAATISTLGRASVAEEVHLSVLSIHEFHPFHCVVIYKIQSKKQTQAWLTLLILISTGPSKSCWWKNMYDVFSTDIWPINSNSSTLPETNIAPENECLEDEFPFGFWPIFRGVRC